MSFVSTFIVIRNCLVCYIITVITLAMSTSFCAFKPMFLTATLHCPAPCRAVAPYYFKQRVWCRTIVHHDWNQLVALRNPTPISGIHAVTLPHPLHNLQVGASCMKVCGRGCWRKSFRFYEGLCCCYLLMKNSVT